MALYMVVDKEDFLHILWVAGNILNFQRGSWPNVDFQLGARGVWQYLYVIKKS